MARKSTDDINSRYIQGGTTEVFPNRLGWWERRTFPSDVSDVEYTIPEKYNLRPDLLAYDIYGKSDYFFLVLQYNNILDVNEEFVTGKIIMLPDPQRVALEMVTRRP